MHRDDVMPPGYDREELYFHELNQKRIEEQRRKLDAERAERAAGAQESADSWMKCPKCGARMDEVRVQEILLEQCSRCEGIYFDCGELQLLLQGRRRVGFLKTLARTLADRKKTQPA